MPTNMDRRTSLVRICLAIMSLMLGAATASAQQPPKAPAVVEVPLPQQVKVGCARPLKAYRADELFFGPVPESFRGATIVSRPIGKPSDDVRGGRIELEIVADGPVVVAASWQSDGRTDPAWSGEVWDGRKFFAEGWRLIDAVDLPDARSFLPTPHFVYLRNCKAGEMFAIRTRKFNPPAVLIPNSPPDEGRIVDWEPDSKLPEERQRDLVAQKFRALLMEKRFDELERWTTRYLKAGAMFPSGHYKIVSTRRLVTHNYPSNRLTEAESRQYLDLSEAWLAAVPRSIPARLTTANLIVSLSEQLENLDSQKNGPEIDEIRRRALEMLFEVEREDPTIVDAYRTTLALAHWAKWSPELVDDYVERILQHCGWSQPALDQAYRYYTQKYEDETPQVRSQRLREFFDLIHERTKERYGDALFAAMLSGWRNRPVDEPMYKLNLQWSKIRISFEDWVRQFPESSRIKQKYCLWACFNGDRETASRLFTEFTDAEADIEEVWGSSDRLACRRAWAAADFASGEQATIIDYPVNSILSAYVRADGRVVIGDLDGVAAVADPQIGTVEKLGLVSHGAPYWHPAAQAFTPDAGRYLYGTYFGYVGFMYLQPSPRYFQRYRKSKGSMTAVAFAPDEETFVAASPTDDFLIYDLPAAGESSSVFSEPLRTWPNERKLDVRGLGFCDAGRTLVILYRDGLVELRNYADGKVSKSWSSQVKTANAMTISSDGAYLATIGNDRAVRVWTLADGELINTLPPLPTVVDKLALSPDGKRLAAGDGYSGIRPSAVHLFDLDAKKWLRAYQGHKASVTALQFLPDGKTLMSASRDHSVRFWTLP